MFGMVLDFSLFMKNPILYTLHASKRKKETVFFLLHISIYSNFIMHYVCFMYLRSLKIYADAPTDPMRFSPSPKCILSVDCGLLE